MTQPKLSRRAIIAYNRFSKDLAALNYVLRKAKPTGMVGDLTLRQFNAICHAANRLFAREPAMPRFLWIDLERPLTVADFAILVSRLTAASLAFEERYEYLTRAPAPAPALDSDGFPSKHV
ncbi:hypothetical protein ASD04_02295 [Devosia sp. Root436]|uniref:hypothetical protein n=1 Tax=Devosia sp. Root436 TaxID=1736537 RepID=UPI0006F6467D|nr:hypothetical protein [Devosia sp. Root436]KQX42813.1 hypothetical protein ASD04_02295 [Devosia sp. Root436]